MSSQLIPCTYVKTRHDNVSLRFGCKNFSCSVFRVSRPQHLCWLAVCSHLISKMATASIAVFLSWALRHGRILYCSPFATTWNLGRTSGHSVQSTRSNWQLCLFQELGICQAVHVWERHFGIVNTSCSGTAIVHFLCSSTRSLTHHCRNPLILTYSGAHFSAHVHMLMLHCCVELQTEPFPWHTVGFLSRLLCIVSIRSLF